MSKSLHVSLDVIDTINVLPRRYHTAMLDVLLRLRGFPQERYDTLVAAITTRAYERRINEDDVEAIGHALTDRRIDEAILDWFLATPTADGLDIERMVERAGSHAFNRSDLPANHSASASSSKSADHPPRS